MSSYRLPQQELPIAFGSSQPLCYHRSGSEDLKKFWFPPYSHWISLPHCPKIPQRVGSGSKGRGAGRLGNLGHQAARCVVVPFSQLPRVLHFSLLHSAPSKLLQCCVNGSQHCMDMIARKQGDYYSYLALSAQLWLVLNLPFPLISSGFCEVVLVRVTAHAQRGRGWRGRLHPFSAEGSQGWDDPCAPDGAAPGLLWFILWWCELPTPGCGGIKALYPHAVKTQHPAPTEGYTTFTMQIWSYIKKTTLCLSGHTEECVWWGRKTAFFHILQRC